MQITDWHEPHLVEALSSYHWLMQSSPRDEVVMLDKIQTWYCVSRQGRPFLDSTGKNGHHPSQVH